MAADDRLIAGVRRIAVLRANAIGDYVFCLPALEALRAAYPRAEIVLLGRRWHRELLTGRPGPIDRVEVVPEDAGLFDAQPAQGARGSHPFFERMRRERFDLALQLYGGGRQSNPFVRRLGARVTAGLRTPDAAPLDRVLPFAYFQHEIARYLEAVALVGARPVTLEPRFAVTETDLAMSREIVRGDSAPIAVLNPGATDPRRRWPLERFAAAGHALADAGARVVINGSGEERAMTSELARRLDGRGQDLAGILPLAALAGLLARCAVLVSNDTGPLHLGNAIGTRSVGIYWAFNYANGCPLMRARHRPLVRWEPRCPACGADNTLRRCEHDVSFVSGVTEREAIDGALAQLDEARREAAPAGAEPPLAANAAD